MHILVLLIALHVVSGTGTGLICYNNTDCAGDTINLVDSKESCCGYGGKSYNVVSSDQETFCSNCSVDCLWAYSPFSECGAADGCDDRRFRIPYIVQEPMYGGDPCPSFVVDATVEYRPCNITSPINCQWNYTQFSQCYFHDDRIPIQTRVPIIQEHHQFGGEPCPLHVLNKLADVRFCQNLLGTPCLFTDWGEWGPWSATCGFRIRSRERQLYDPQDPLCEYVIKTAHSLSYSECPDIQIKLEKEMYEVYESAQSLEICAIVENSSNSDCPANSTLIINLVNSSDTTDYNDYLINTSRLIFKPCSKKACLGIIIIDDALAEKEESFSVYLQGSLDLPYNVIVSPNISVVTIVDTDVMIVGFDSSVFTAIENEGEVEVCVSVFNSPSGALDSFAVAFIPAEEYQVSNEQYVLECNRNDTFSVGSHQVCINYTVYDDNVCELQHHNDSYFEIRLLILLTTDRGPFLDFNHSIAAVTIDDSRDEECFVCVGYEQERYVLNDEIGYAELCIKASSSGLSVEFSISLEINNTDNIELTQNIEALRFSVSESERNETKCYSISGYYNDSCSSFPDCQNLLTSAYFEWYNGSNRITLDTSEVEVEIELPWNCLMNCSTFFSSFDTPDQPPSTNIMTDQTNNDGVFIAVASSLSGLVLTIIAILTTLLMLFILTRKRRKEFQKGITDGEVRYVASGHSKSALSDELKQLLNDKRMIISKDFVKLSSTIGQGESGLVYRAYLTTLNGKELVAVKTVKALFSNTDVARLAKEISTMLSFNHPNVMSLIGVCIDAEVPLLIMPYMSNGSLLSYVKLHKDRLLHKTEKSEGQKPGQVLLGMCYQVAKGMEYLSQQRFVHRDLAARNCMLGKNGVIKVADFGLTEDMYGTNYFRRSRNETGSEEKVPIRWMAPESIENDVYTEATDVWSYGVTVWEVFTCGRIPYTGIPVMSLLKSLQRGERLERPDNEACTDEIYEIMKECWNAEDKKRPKFQELVGKIDNLLEVESGYLSLSPTGNDYAVPFITTHSETSESCL